jgi:transcriptional regulator GlxA family with amidase domain
VSTCSGVFVLAATGLLDGGRATAESVGLQTAATLREHFRRILKTTPTAYRRAFFVTGRPGRTRKASPSKASRPWMKSEYP